MEKLITYIIIIVCYILSPTGTNLLLSTAGTGYIKYEEEYVKALEAQKLAEQQAIEKAKQDAILAEQKLHTYLLFKRTELDEYGFVELPSSHLTLNKDKSSNKEKVYDYLDGLSYLKIYYKINLTDDELNSLGRKVCGLVEEPEYTDYVVGKYQVKELTTSTQYDGFNRKIWCRIKGKSVMVFDFYTAPGLDTSPINELMQDVLNTINVYYVSGTVFETPSTGYYASNDFLDNKDKEEDKQVITTKPVEYENEEGYVGGQYSGTVVTNLVTNDWRDLVLYLDGDKLWVPSRVDDFTNLGYKIKDASAIGDLVKPGYDSTIVLYKDNGVTIRLKAKNNTDSSLRVGALEVTTLTIDSDDFGYYSSKSVYSNENLPELILVGGITWDIEAENLTEIIGIDFYKNELGNGDYEFTYKYDNKKMVITTKNYKDIRKIVITDNTEY